MNSRYLAEEPVTGQPQDITVYPVYAVPRGITFEAYTEWKIVTAEGTLILSFPLLTPAKIQEIATMVKTRRTAYLARLGCGRIVDIIDAAVQQWLNPQYELRRRAESWLPSITGYDAGMIKLELKRYMRLFRRKELLRFLDEELESAALLDEFRPRKSGGMSRAYGPELIFQVSSGNVPGLPVWSLVMGLLVKSASLMKTSSSEPLMAVLFAESLRQIDPELADCIAVLPWRSSCHELEASAMEASEMVVAYGSDEAVRQIRSRLPDHKRLVSYGHKISFAMVGKEALTPDRYVDTVYKLVKDAGTYDQQSCLSPHSVFVEEGGAVSARQVAQLLAAELQRLQLKHPLAPITREEAQAIQALRSRYELAALGGSGGSVYGSKPGTEWTVVYHPGGELMASPLNRTVHVISCPSLEEIIPSLSRHRRYLQSAGIAVGPERLQRLADALGEAGINRICAIGQMTRAAAGWHHDGRYNLLDLLRWTDLEWSAEQNAESYDPDAEQG
ncbi:acyl-CoA reductase [Paenibacillus nasutitermitis]|uniref:Acyl-CoA reductase n=1 Tax=Paenibacillus nasutitermitis TaxID=1652958 RepID=A0A916YPS3_9BACL|nr:acyl-CoA reductase [Paenibacillus nasutitermitis]GGD55526.1 acyl-CoA reductase [Paenibacillus nasutitermitis]